MIFSLDTLTTALIINLIIFSLFDENKEYELLEKEQSHMVKKQN
jgi:hypothetical protein